MLAAVAVSRGNDGIAARWEGSAQIPGRELKVIVDLAQESANAKWSGSITLPGLNAKGAPLDVAVTAPEVTFVSKTALADQRGEPMKFKGRLEGAQQLVGEIAQGGHTAPLVLQRIGPPQVEPVPRSTAIAMELEGEWNGEYELFGFPRKVTITLHNGAAEGATAEFVIVGKKENKLPVDRVAQQGDFVTIDSREAGLTFEGRAGKGEIRGTILQGPLELPVVLRRKS